MPTNSKSVLILRKLLEPKRKELHRRYIRNTFADAFNQSIWVLPAAAAVWFIVCEITAWSGKPVESWRYWSWLSVPAVFILWLAAAGIWAVFHRPDWQIVAKQVDDVTNKHNLVAIAYEHSGSETPSLFAKASIHQGIDLLNSSDSYKINPPRHSISIRRASKGLFIAILLLAIPLWLSAANSGTAGFSGKNKKISDNSELSLQLQESVQLKQSALGRNVGENKKTDNKTVESQSKILTAQNIQELPGASGRESASAGRAGGQAGQSSSPRFGGTASSQNMDEARNSPRDVKTSFKSGKAGLSGEQKEYFDSLSHNAQNGASGLSPNSESDLKAMTAGGGIEELSDQDDSFLDKQEQNQNFPAGIGQRPLLSDNQVAPNRDLGMSGKPGDKAGDGRGGPGQIKKSRATASSLSATTIPIQVKGRTQPGKSKSYTQSLPLSAIEQSAVLSDEDDRRAKEGDVSLYIPDEKWKSIIEYYFLNLRNENLK